MLLLQMLYINDKEIHYLKLFVHSVTCVVYLYILVSQEAFDFKLVIVYCISGSF